MPTTYFKGKFLDGYTGSVTPTRVVRRAYYLINRRDGYLKIFDFTDFHTATSHIIIFQIYPM